MKRTGDVRIIARLSVATVAIRSGSRAVSRGYERVAGGEQDTRSLARRGCGHALGGRRRRARKRAELLEEAEAVELNPSFDDPPVLDLQDRDA